MKKLIIPIFTLFVFASCGENNQDAEKNTVDSLRSGINEKRDAGENEPADRDQQIADSVAKTLENLN